MMTIRKNRIDFFLSKSRFRIFSFRHVYDFVVIMKIEARQMEIRLNGDVKGVEIFEPRRDKSALRSRFYVCKP